MKTDKSDLVCLKCGNIDTIQRRCDKKKKVGHIKDFWCYKCQSITKHYEVRDINVFLENECISEEKQQIISLVRSRRKQCGKF